jgi:hypothetical protein
MVPKVQSTVIAAPSTGGEDSPSVVLVVLDVARALYAGKAGKHRPRCSFCGRQPGVCVTCADDCCATSFHPLCARLAGCLSLQDPREDNSWADTGKLGAPSLGAAATVAATVAATAGKLRRALVYCRKHAAAGWERLEPSAHWVMPNAARSLRSSLDGPRHLLDLIARREGLKLEASNEEAAELSRLLAALASDPAPVAALKAMLGDRTAHAEAHAAALDVEKCGSTEVSAFVAGDSMPCDTIAEAMDEEYTEFDWLDDSASPEVSCEITPLLRVLCSTCV